LILRSRLIFVLYVACLLLADSPLHADGNILRIGTDATFAPLESKEGDKYVGFDIDLGEAIGRSLGMKVEWTNSGFDGIFAALQAGKFDLVMSSVTITEDRKRQLAFSDPYYTAGQALASRKDGVSYTSLEQLSGKTVGIQINTTAKEVLKKKSGINIREYNSIDLALLDLQNGKLDAVMTDAPVLKHMLLRSFSGLEVASTVFSDEKYGITTRPADKDLLLKVNEALRRIEASGELAKLKEKYFGEKAEAGARPLRTGELLAAIWLPLVKAAGMTVQLTLFALLFGVPIGLAVALMRLNKLGPFTWLASIYVEVLRGTPLLVQIFTVYYVLPALGITLAAWPAALLAFSLNSAAYIAEIFRGGIQSIDPGQMEAARSLGMSYSLAMRLVVLPQAFRRVLPPLTNEAIALLKDTSLVSVIALIELTRRGQELTGQYARPMVIWPLVGLIYLILTVPLTRLANWLERKWAAR
jgi:lysine-arginine-ornithine-binding protein